MSPILPAVTLFFETYFDNLRIKWRLCQAVFTKVKIYDILVIIMKLNIDKDAAITRLRRIEGQVRGVIRMVEEDKTCEEILVQVASLKSSLHKTGISVFEEHFKNCVNEGVRKGKANETVKKLSASLEQFSRLL